MAKSNRSFYGATAGRDRRWLLHFVRSQWFRRGRGPILNATWRGANATVSCTLLGASTFCSFALRRRGKHFTGGRYLTRPCPRD